MGRGSIEIPKGFKRSTLKRNEFLLVRLSVKGSLQNNFRTRGGTALLLREFSIVTKIINKTPPKQYRDLSQVLPNLGKIISVNTELAQDFANHLWHLGIETDVNQMKRNHDPTGRKKGDIELIFRWFLEGPIPSQ